MSKMKFDVNLKGKNGDFKGAAQNYNTANGTVCVGFTTTEAFVMEDSEGLYELADLKYNFTKIGLAASDVREATQVATSMGVNADSIAKYGLSEHAGDIVERVRELCKMEII